MIVFSETLFALRQSVIVIKIKHMDSNLLERIRIDAIETCAVTGIMIKKNTEKGHPEYIHAPISLFPLVYPADLLQKALEM